MMKLFQKINRFAWVSFGLGLLSFLSLISGVHWYMMALSFLGAFSGWMGLLDDYKAGIRVAQFGMIFSHLYLLVGIFHVLY